MNTVLLIKMIILKIKKIYTVYFPFQGPCFVFVSSIILSTPMRIKRIFNTVFKIILILTLFSGFVFTWALLLPAGVTDFCNQNTLITRVPLSVGLNLSNQSVKVDWSQWPVYLMLCLCFFILNIYFSGCIHQARGNFMHIFS